MRKFENYFITIVMGIMMMLTSIRGLWEFVYCDLDMYYDQTVVIVEILSIFVIYWFVKSIVIRLKNK